MIGTSDQSCWLAEACKTLLLLLTGCDARRDPRQTCFLFTHELKLLSTFWSLWGIEVLEQNTNCHEDVSGIA